MNNLDWQDCIEMAIYVIKRWERKRNKNRIWPKIEISPDYINVWFHKGKNVRPKLFCIDKDISYEEAENIFKKVHKFMDKKSADNSDVDNI